MVLKREFRGSSRRRPASASRAFIQESTPPSSLTDAVQFGDKKTLRRLLREGVNLEQVNARGETALILAAKAGDYEALQLLLDAGAYVDARSAYSATALMAAAQNGDRDAIRLLVSRGADVDAKKRDGTTAMMLAAMSGHAHSVEDMIALGGDIHAKDIYGFDAFMMAEGNQECLDVLHAAAAREKARENRPPPAKLRKALSAAGKKGRKARREAVREKLRPAVVTSLPA